MGHLRAVAGGLVKSHVGLVATVDGLVGKETSSRDHRSSHTVTNEEDEVLGLLAVGNRLDLPGSLLGLTTVEGEDDLVLAGVVELDIAVRLGDDVDRGRRVGLLGEEVLVPGEVVRLGLGVLEAEELGDVNELGALTTNLEREVGVDLAAVVSLGAVDGRLDLNTDVESL